MKFNGHKYSQFVSIDLSISVAINLQLTTRKICLIDWILGFVYIFTGVLGQGSI